MKITLNNTEYEVRVSEQKLPPEIKSQWLEALRSGKFLQGKHMLCTGNLIKQYCCLGVLSHVQGRLTQSGYDGITDTVLCHNNPLNWLNDVRVADADGAITLIGLNDNGMPFTQIADIIEYAL